MTYHGGALDGFYSQVSFMPRERIGTIVFVIGRHCSSLTDIVSYNVYERLLGMDLTPWSERWLEVRQKGKQADIAARARAGTERVPGTRPSHALADFAGEYEHPAYGILKIGLKDGELQFDFHKVRLPLTHFHYDRFDTPDDEIDGKWSVNFATNPQGDLEQAVMSLDEAEVVFNRKPEAPDPLFLKRCAGNYETPTGSKFHVVLKEDGYLYLVFIGEPESRLIPYKGTKFRIQQFSDALYEFAQEDGEVKALKERNPSGVIIYTRK